MRSLMRNVFVAAVCLMAALSFVSNAQDVNAKADKKKDNPYSASKVLHTTLERYLASNGAISLPTVSIVTVCPGSEIYELYGHAAVRIKIGGYDFSVNYGLFDFDTPFFAYRFVKGETDYLVDVYPTWIFMRDYSIERRRVIEQQLNLTDVQTVRLIRLIENDLKPENQTYRYKYLRENCSTKIVDIVEKAIGDTIAFGRPQSQGLNHWTFRDIMDHFNEGYEWNDFGIDMVLGNGIDYPISNRENYFSPMLLSEMLSKATITDSIGAKIPAVKATNVLIPGRAEGCKKPPTPWWCTPMTVFIVTFLFSLILFRRDIRRKKPTRWFDCLFFGLMGLAGLLITFLVFFSAHEAVSPNILFAVLNPLCLIGAFGIFSKRLRKIVMYYHWYNIAATVIMLAVLYPISGQVINGAMWPLLLTSVARSFLHIKLSRCTETNVKKVRA